MDRHCGGASASVCGVGVGTSCMRVCSRQLDSVWCCQLLLCVQRRRSVELTASALLLCPPGELRCLGQLKVTFAFSYICSRPLYQFYCDPQPCFQGFLTQKVCLFFIHFPFYLSYKRCNNKACQLYFQVQSLSFSKSQNSVIYNIFCRGHNQKGE